MRCLIAAGSGNAAAGPARTGNTTVVSALVDGAVSARSASSDRLPDNLAVVAETELVGAVADNGAVLSADA